MMVINRQALTGIRNEPPVLFEPTDVPLASKPFQTTNWKSIKYITPNLQELKEMAKYLNLSLPNNQSHLDMVSEAASLAKLMANYIPNIIVTLGNKGLLIACKHEATEALLVQKHSVNTDRIQLRHYPVQDLKTIVNVSGAGDCLTSGLIVAMLKGLSEELCISVGYAAAQFSLASQSAIPDVLFDENHKAWSSRAAYTKL